VNFYDLDVQLRRL